MKILFLKLNLGERVSSFYKDSLLFLGDNEGFVHVFNWKKDHCEFVEVKSLPRKEIFHT
jgi:hypothetical protein